MRFDAKFFKFAAVCSALSAVTTLGVHLLPRLYAGPNEFDRLVTLHADSIYIFRLYVVLLHILLVVAAMWGVAAKKLKDYPGIMILGFLGYLLFAAAELFRTSLGLFALNRGWRAAYTRATDEAVRASFHTLIDGWPGISSGFFFLIVLGFLIGNLLYGWVIVRGVRFERIVGIALLVWAAIGTNTLISESRGVDLVSMPEWISWTFQPAVRILVAVWLWRTPTIFLGHGNVDGQTAEPVASV